MLINFSIVTGKALLKGTDPSTRPRFPTECIISFLLIMFLLTLFGSNLFKYCKTPFNTVFVGIEWSALNENPRYPSLSFLCEWGFTVRV